MIRRYVGFVVTYPKTVVAMILAITLALGLSITRLRVLLDVDDQMPQRHALVMIGKRIESLFGGKYLTVIGFYPKQGTIYEPQLLAKVKRVTEAIENIPGVNRDRVLSLMSARTKDVRSTDDALSIRPLAPTVPRTAAELAAFQERVKHNHTVTSLLVSEDGRATVVLVDFDDFQQAGGSAGFYPKLESILQRERSPGLEIESAGAPSVLYWLLVYTRRAAALFILTLAMIGFLHYRAFRTLQGMVVPLVTALLGVIWALGLMGLVRAPMDPWNIMTPILLLAIGAGHSVQILKRYYEEFGRIGAARPDLTPREVNREAVIEATTKMGTVMLAAGSIAALSFASLLALGVQSLRNFGLCTAFGIAAALIVELTFIPAIRVLLPAPSARQTARERKQEIFDPLLDGLANIMRQRRERPILWISAAVILVAGIGVFRIETRNSLGAQFFEANGPVHGFRLADERTAGTRVIQVLVEGKAPEAIMDADVLQRMDSLGAFIEHLPFSVGKVVSIVDVLKTLNRVLDGDKASSEVLPKTRVAAAQYLLLYSMSGDEGDLRRLVDSEYRSAVITAYLRTDDHRVLKKLVTALQDEAKRQFAGLPVTVSVGGGVTNALALNEVMVKGKINNLIQISLLVFVITSLALRSFLGGLLVLLPLATAALVNLGLMGWAGIPLTMGTAAISAMAVGIGADYAIYFIFRVREQLRHTPDLREATAMALLTSGKAIAYVATAVAGGYLCLTLSGFKVHVLLGLLVALTMVTCSTATVAMLPAIILNIKPRFLSRR